MKQILIILTFEYKNFVKSSSFIIMTLIFLLVGIIGPTIPTIGIMRGSGLLNSFFGGEGETLALVDPANLIPTADETLTFIVELYPNLEAATDAMQEGLASYAAEVHGYDFTLYVPSMKLSVYNIQLQLSNLIRREYRMETLNTLGIDVEKVENILDYTPKGEVVTISVSDSPVNYQENILYAYVMIFLLYFGMFSTGQYVLTTVIREKSTKTMELLVTSCKSGNLINGKVLGVGLAALTQLICLAGAAIISMNINGRILLNSDGVSAVLIRPDIIALLIIFFVLGIFTYAYLYAGLASTVSRMEDANSAAGFPMMLIMVGFLAAMAGLVSPGAAWVTTLSYVPIFTPMVMFTRVCLGTAAVWEIVLGILLQLVTIAGMGWLCGRIYRIGTLVYGNRLSMKDVFAAIKE